MANGHQNGQGYGGCRNKALCASNDHSVFFKFGEGWCHTIMSISTFLKEKASKIPARVLLPEGGEARILEAAQKAAEKKVCLPIVLLNKSERSRAESFLEKAKFEIIEADNSELKNQSAAKWAKIKKIQLPAALELINDRIYLATALLFLGYADSMVAGAVHSTKDVLKPSLEARKLYPGIPPVTSSFIMDISAGSVKENNIFVFADCGLNPEPSAAMLAHIANAADAIARELCCIGPKVALLSFSSKGSADHPSVTKVRQALEIARKKFPFLDIDGELQADAAIVDWIGKAKAPESSVAGKANVLIFPDLNSGNIAYKLVERLAGAKAVGPIISGLNPPVNDLSRGCCVEDIIDMCAISSIQANKLKIS